MTDKAKEEQIMDWHAIGDRIKKAREKAGFVTQKELAAAAGIRQQAISAVEYVQPGSKPKESMTVENLSRIALACHVSLDYLVFGKGDEEKEWDTLYPYGECIAHMVNQLGAKPAICFKEHGIEGEHVRGDLSIYIKVPISYLGDDGEIEQCEFGFEATNHPLCNFIYRMEYVSNAPRETDKSLLEEEARRAVNLLRDVPIFPEQNKYLRR